MVIFHGWITEESKTGMVHKICKVYPFFKNQSSDRINLKDQENHDFVPGENPYFGEEL